VLSLQHVEDAFCSWQRAGGFEALLLVLRGCLQGLFAWGWQRDACGCDGVFNGMTIAPNGIFLLSHPDGRPSGEVSLRCPLNPTCPSHGCCIL